MKNFVEHIREWAIPYVVGAFCIICLFVLVLLLPGGTTTGGERLNTRVGNCVPAGQPGTMSTCFDGDGVFFGINTGGGIGVQP